MSWEKFEKEASSSDRVSYKDQRFTRKRHNNLKAARDKYIDTNRKAKTDVKFNKKP